MALALHSHHQGDSIFTQVGDKKLKTILQTFQTFITVEISLKSLMALPFLSWWSSHNESKWILNPIGLCPQFRFVEALLHLSLVPDSRHFEDSGSAESPPARNSKSVLNGKKERGVWPTWLPIAPHTLLHHYLATAGYLVLLLAHFQHRLCLPLYLLSSKWTAGS